MCENGFWPSYSLRSGRYFFYPPRTVLHTQKKFLFWRSKNISPVQWPVAIWSWWFWDISGSVSDTVRKNLTSSVGAVISPYWNIFPSKKWGSKRFFFELFSLHDENLLISFISMVTEIFSSVIETLSVLSYL